jgi:hypothetical protein
MASLPFLAQAQNATIVGTVTDPSGAVVPNVTITITDVDTTRAVVFTSNDAGQYVVPDLPIGHYNVKASVTGFKTAERLGIVLNAGDRIRVDFQLVLGTTAQSVSVEANPVAVQTDTGQVDSLSTGTQISELATNGRTLYSYVSLTPGASSLNPDSQLPVPTGGASSNVSFNGERVGHNLYLLDGGENSDRGGAGSSSVLPSTDAIAEMQTMTSNYSAEYGLSSGGTISSVIKSGTKTLHASAWEFFRNDALDARGFFNPAPQAVAELRYNIFGFNVGGPVTFGHLYNPDKKKTFFFYNMEWRKFINPSSVNTNVPLTSEYGGNFGTNVIDVPAATLVSSAVLLRNCPTGTTLASLGLTQGAAFPNNQIPACMISPNATALLNVSGSKYGGILPAPNAPGGAYYGKFTEPVSAPTDLREEIVRIDQNFSDKFTIYGHYVAESASQGYATTMWSSDNVPTVANTFGNPSYAGVVHAAYTISPSLINETAFNYNGNRIHILPSGLATAPSNFTFNRFFSGPNNGDRIPTINLATEKTNYTSNWTPWNNLADDYQIRDDVSWTKGRHQLKMGVSWAIYKKTQDWFKNTQGGFNFDGGYTGIDFADFLLGLAEGSGNPWGYTEDAVKATGQWNNISWAAYLQDNWRVNNRLTLNLGLRWDGIPHTYEANYNMADFYPNLYDAANPATFGTNADGTTNYNIIATGSKGLGSSPNSIITTPIYVNGLSVCGQNGTPRGCVNDAWKNFGPRLGFAYDLRGNGKTVIRGGYGIMYERIQGNDVYNNAGTPPLAASVNFSAATLDNPKINPLTGAATPASIPVSSMTVLDQANYRPPLSTQFSAGVQQAIGKSVLSVTYVGTQDRHQSYSTEINLPAQSLLPTLATSAAARTAYNSNLPYLGFGNIQMERNEANSDYNGLQVGFRGSLLTSDLTYQLGYTYSKANDPAGTGDSMDMTNVSDPYLGWKYDWGPSVFDHRQVMFANFVYQIPLLKHSDNHFAKTMIGGWELSGIVTAESGAPINIGIANSGGVNFVTTGNSANRPNVTGSGGDPHTQAEWFNTALYSNPAPGAWGTTPYDSVVGPGRDNWNISLFKNFLFSESRGSNLQFRAEFFNIWNHTQWKADGENGGINNTFNGAGFGQITAAYDPRIIQLALKLYF